MHFNPPASCVLEISVRGVKIGVKADDCQEAKVAALALSPSSPSPSPTLTGLPRQGGRPHSRCGW